MRGSKRIQVFDLKLTIKHFSNSSKTLFKKSYRERKNYFHGMKIYYHDMKKYYHDKKIYFHVVKIVFDLSSCFFCRSLLNNSKKKEYC